LDAVDERETVLALFGTWLSAAVSMANSPAPAKLEGTVHRHWLLVKWKGVDQKSF